LRCAGPGRYRLCRDRRPRHRAVARALSLGLREESRSRSGLADVGADRREHFQFGLPGEWSPARSLAHDERAGVRHEPNGLAVRRPRLIFGGLGIMVLLGGTSLMTNGYVGWDRPSAGFAYIGPIISFGLGLAIAAIGWWPENVAARVLLGVVGLAVSLYGVASITGGWLGTPPWQLRRVDRLDWISRHPVEISPSMFEGWGTTIVVRDSSGSGGFLSAYLAAVGLTLVVVAAWPRYVHAEAEREDASGAPLRRSTDGGAIEETRRRAQSR
jgi:hypothetical protein